MKHHHRNVQLSKTTLVLLLLFAFTGSALAQSSTTATIRGNVLSEGGSAAPGAEVSAVSTTSGFTHSATTRADGSYSLAGLTPGSYTIVVSSGSSEPKSQEVMVQVGQTLDLDFQMGPGMVLSESITVVGNQLIETKSTEAATNVSPLQIESLPQNERNFLNFAALAPGVRISRDPQRKTIAGDAQNAEQTNIFIDGVSFKNDVLQGGVAGQDASRGNPFPQNAVQEFRVITQNYSAQYDKASGAIITAITKSGGNQIDGQAFVYYQPKEWVEDTPGDLNFNPDFARVTAVTNDSYHRYQTGLNFGGPVIRDRLHYFLSYEGDQEHATKVVTVGNPAFANQFGQFTGVFPAPFRSTLLFGKGSWQPGSSSLLDLSANYRKENEIRDFGGQDSAEAATNLKNKVQGATLRHQWTGSATLNQATLSWQKYQWNAAAKNPDLVGLDFQGAIRLGGRSSNQQFDQRRIELRDDYNFAAFQWRGMHNFQVGGNLDFLEYKVNKSQDGNPVYRFRNDPNNGFNFNDPLTTGSGPFEASYGFGNPNLSIDNQQYGIYGQDNWIVNNRLTVNLGLRWDYESDLIDTSYVTPANIVAGLTGKVDSSYFSTGSNREQFKSAFQPRVGFAYDFFGNGRSVAFGGAGRYYDRIFLNSTLDERYRLQFPVYNIQFSPDGRPGTIKWNPSYLTPAGLDALISQGRTFPEIYLLRNDLKPPYSNQFNVGYRQTLGSWLGSISYNVVRGYRGLTYLSASGICCAALVPGFGNVIISDPEGKRHWYDAIHLTLDRPFTSQNRWGARLAYTYAESDRTGNDLFSLDLPSAAAYGRHAVPGSERNRVVATGIFGLPFEVRFSTIVSLGSGEATNVLDFSQGFDLAARLRTHPFSKSIYPEKKGGFAERNVDLRLEKEFALIAGTSLGVIGEVFNAFNQATFGCLANFIPPEGNPGLGNPGCVSNLGRRFQLGVRVGL